MQDLLLISHPAPGVVKWTMNRPQAFNALSEDLLTGDFIDADQACKWGYPASLSISQSNHGLQHDG